MTRIAIIGAGIGGLAVGALLAKAGFDVTVYEGQSYVGGCASTFTHKGYRFDSGATVVGGFQPNGPHALIGDMLNIQWPIHQYDPAWVVHMPNHTVQLTQDNVDVLKNFPNTAAFWDEQSRIADLGWSLSSQGLPWPPTDIHEWLQIATVGIRNLPQDLQIIPFALMNTGQWLKLRGLAKDKAFKRFLDGQLLISAQTTTQHAYALYSATALDLARQGVYHAEGGIGGVAEAIAQKLISLGGQIHYKHHVTRIAIENGTATGLYTKNHRKSKRERFHPADFIIANLTPFSLEKLIGNQSPQQLSKENQHRKDGYGAFVLHVGVQADKLPNGFADHHQFLMDIEGNLGEGRSLFMSLSPEWDTTRAPMGERAVTITTHTRIKLWWDLINSNEDEYYKRKEAYTRAMITNINHFVPGFRDAITYTLSGTPITYNFYTGRHRGMVGGFPQTSLFNARGPRTGIDNIRLVGDSIFPGQSTAGVSLGAIRVSEDVQRNLPITQKTVTFSQQRETVS